MNKVLYAGSFDPFTNGHLDIVTQASDMFDGVIIAIAQNSDKQEFLPVKTRLEMIRKSVANLENVSVDSYLGLTTDYAKKNGVNILVRGVRNSTDFEYELQLKKVNTMLAPDIKTVLLFPKEENLFISSSAVREIYNNGGDISKLVPCLW